MAEKASHQGPVSRNHLSACKSEACIVKIETRNELTKVQLANYWEKKSTSQLLIFKWSHVGISSTDSKVRTTFRTG